MTATKKRIGTCEGKPVVELMTSGGLYMVVMNKNGELDTLGTGGRRLALDLGGPFGARDEDPAAAADEGLHHPRALAD